MTSVKQKILKNFCKLFLPLFPKKDGRPLLKIKKSVGVTTLLCHRDVTMFIYALNSLFYHLEYQLPVFIVDDGSLTKADKKTLLQHFHAHIEDTASADVKMKKFLKRRSFIFKNRFSTTNGKYKLKLDAILLHPFKRFIHLDADVLFFAPPTQIKRWIEKEEKRYFYPSYPEEIFARKNPLEFSLRTIIYKYLKIRITRGFNSGVLLFPERIEKDLDEMNQLFKFFDELSLLDFDGLDDLFLAVFFGKKKNRYVLPESFYGIVFLCSELDEFLKKAESVIAIHFGWQTKGKFYEYGIREALKSNFFQKN